MRPIYTTGLLTCILLGNLLFPASVSTAPGTPASFEFANGVRINLRDPQWEQALYLAAAMQVDYVAFDFDWGANQPQVGTWNEKTPFSQALHLTRSLGLATLVSITHAPSWAMTPRGPDQGLVAAVVSQLANQSPQLVALELFPEANTVAGWGSTPDPRAYAALFQVAQAQIDSENPGIYLIAAGVSNVLTSPEDMKDVDYLQGLYNAGVRPALISLHLNGLEGNPLAAPSERHLRHYEDLRAVMLANDHQTGLLWITSLELPEQISPAYEQLRAQLYLGAAFVGNFSGVELQPVCLALLAAQGADQSACTTAQRSRWMLRKQGKN